METISIQINNSKAKQLLKDLAKLNLITIKPQVTLQSLLEKQRVNSNEVPTLDEITAEVKQVRKRDMQKGHKIIIDTNLWMNYLLTKQ